MTLGSSRRVVTLQSQTSIRLYIALEVAFGCKPHLQSNIKTLGASIGSDDIVFRIRAENPRGRTLSGRPYGKLQ